MDRNILRKALLVPAMILALVLPLGMVACGDDGGPGGTASLPWFTTTTDAAAADGTAPTSTTTISPTTGAEPALTNATASAAETLQNGTTDIVSPAEIVARQVSASVVNVRVKGVVVSTFYGEEQYEGVGSGLVYTSDGYILTNDHVISQNGQPADAVEVTMATGEVLDAAIVARDAANDLALLKIDKTGLQPVIFAASDGVKVGQWAIAIGSPLDYRNSVTVGIVSGLDRELESGDPTSPQLTGLLQTDAAISPGNSGGGLFNAAGQLIGMPEAYISPTSGAESMGFAIPADKVAALAEQLMAQHQ